MANKITFSAKGYSSVTVFHDDAPVTVSGYGGWTTVQRQRRVALTQWQGKDPLRMDVPILFDGFRAGTGQEAAITALSHMALPTTQGHEPPVVAISGPAVPKPGPTRWVIDSIDWGAKTIYDHAGNGVTVRMRQDAIVHLLQYQGDERVAFRDIALGSPAKRGWPKSYTVKAGDTLQKIAARKDVYGDSTKWRKIAQANKIRDGKHLKPNTKLRIPAP